MNRKYFFPLYTSEMLFMLEKRKITLTVFTWKQHKKKPRGYTLCITKRLDSFGVIY